MPSAAYNLFREAVTGKKQIVCMYQNFERELCPHCLGYKDGREKVLSFQFAGSSSRGLPPQGQWRCMFLDEVTNVRIREGEWRTGTGHSQTQTCVDDVDVEVRF
jgi:predicted DNA-binding transcriptional regulator YafY